MNGMQHQWGAASAYRTVEGIGASTEDFMKMALDASRNLLLRAEAAIAAADQVGKARALGAAGSIVEFMLGLSGFAPGELSRRFASVYQYVLAAILKGNAENDAEAIGAARVALEELAAAWRTIFPDVSHWEEPGPDLVMSGRLDHA